MPSDLVLQTWKEISEYVGRTERTLQRWEQQFGFPVHRPSGKSRSSVMALAQEIHEWTRGKPSLVLIRRTAGINRARFEPDAGDGRNSGNQQAIVPPRLFVRTKQPTDSAEERLQLSGVLRETQRNLQVMKRLLREQQGLHEKLLETGKRKFFAQ